MVPPVPFGHSADAGTPAPLVHVTGGRVFGGIETMLLTLADASSTPAPIAMAFAGRLAEELEARAYPHVVFGGDDVRASRPLTLWRARERLVQVLRASGARIALYHGPWTLALFGGAARAVGAMPVLMVHGGFGYKVFPDSFARWRRPRGVIANSAWTARQLHAPFPRARIEVVHPAVSTPVAIAAAERERIRAGLGATPDDVVILLVGRMEAWKGQEVLLDALERLSASPGWQAWLVGGAQRPEERELAATLTARAASPALRGRVHVLGQRANARELMAAADVYCQPNLRPEPFGIALVEALAAGLPVVTTAAGGALEIVDEDCGVLVEAAERPELADRVAGALRALLTDGAARRRMSAAARARAADIADPARQSARLTSAACRVAGVETTPDAASADALAVPARGR